MDGVLKWDNVLGRRSADGFLAIIVCLLARFPQEGHDCSVHLPPSIQVCSNPSCRGDFGLMRKEGQLADLGISRVGDIVDIKANGAVQKG